MKRILNLASALIIISACLVGCSEKQPELGHYTTETSGPTPQPEGFNELTVLTPDKIELSKESTFKFAWESGDIISVFENGGEWVADMKIKDAAAAVSVFAVEGETRLEDNAKYVAVYPARSNDETTYEEYLEGVVAMNAEQTQLGNTFDHIKGEMFLHVDFKGKNPITFDYKKSVVAINFSIEEGSTPAFVNFDGGNSELYSLELLPETKASAVSYIAYMVVNPSLASSEERPLIFTVLSSSGDELLNKEIKTQLGFGSGDLYSVNLDKGTITEGVGNDDGGDEGGGDVTDGDANGNNEDLKPEDGTWE